MASPKPAKRAKIEIRKRQKVREGWEHSWGSEKNSLREPWKRKSSENLGAALRPKKDITSAPAPAPLPPTPRATLDKHTWLAPRSLRALASRCKGPPAIVLDGNRSTTCNPASFKHPFNLKRNGAPCKCKPGPLPHKKTSPRQLILRSSRA